MMHLQRSGLRLGLVCLVAVAVGMLGPPAAGANHFDVSVCHANQGTYLNPGGSGAAFAGYTQTSGGYYANFDQCADPSTGLGASSYSGYDSPAGNLAGQRFQAPSGDQIERIQMWRSIFDFGRGNGGTSQRAYVEALADGAPTTEVYDGSADVPYGAAGAFDHTNNGINSSNYLNIDLASKLPSVFAYQLGCANLAPCPTGGNNPAVAGGADTQFQLYGAVVSVRDNSPPTASLENSGLLSPGPQTGTVPLTLTASDEAGIARLEIYAAGHGDAPAIAQDLTHTSSCSFWLASPCQNLTNYHDPIDTTQLPNGTYYLLLKAYDPAGNPVTATSPQPITVNNTTAHTCATCNARRPGAPNPADAGHRRSLTVRFARRAVIRGRLTGSRRAPLGGVVLDVLARVQGPGARFVLLGHTTTRANGTYRFLVAPGPSRLIQVVYPAHPGDQAPRIVQSVVEHVRAGATLAIRPRHVRNHQRIRFTGRLLGGYIPAGGRSVEIQVLVGRHWQDVTAAHAGANGRFRAGYRFKRTTIAVIYTFRAVVRAEGGYPYVIGASAIARVRVN